MTDYRYMSTVATNGYIGVNLVYTGTTPLGDTYQAERIYVQAFSQDEAKKKIERLCKTRVAELVDYYDAGAESVGGYGSERFTVGEDTYYFPASVMDALRNSIYDGAVEDAMNATHARLVARGVIDESDSIM